MCPRSLRAALRLAAVVGFVFGVSGPVEGQSLYSAGFERDINRYRWTSDLSFSERIGAWTLDLKNAFRSDAFALFDDRLSFRDEDRLSLNLRRTLGGHLFSIYGTAGWFSLSRVLSHSLFAGMRFSGPGELWFEPLLGASVDRRPGFSEGVSRAPLRTDAGPAVGFRFGMPSTFVDEYEIELQGEGRFQKLSPRQGRSIRAFGSARRIFEQTRIRTSVKVASVRRDAYQAASFLNRTEASGRLAETVESTRSDTIIATIDIERSFQSGFLLGGRLDISANARQVRTLRAPESVLFFDSDFSRRVVEGEISSSFSRNELFLRFSVRAGAEVERRSLANEDALPIAQAAQKLNILRQADNDRGFISVQLNARVPVGSRTVLQADVSANILRHDTPLVNPDDRDELFYNGLLGVRTRLSRYLEIQLQLFASYFHTVYIKSERSAENNIHRSLRLRPTIRWRPASSTRIDLATQVRATYTVDDFLLPGRRPTDQSARELRYDLDAEHDFGKGIRLRATGRLSDLRLGRFLDDVFAEIPFDTLRTGSAWVRLQVGRRISAEIGFRSFIRSDFNRAATVKYIRKADDPNEEDLPATVTRPGREIIAQNGPTVSLVWPLRDGAFLRLDGWATVQRITHRLYGDLPEGFEDAIRRSARKGKRTLIPNLAISMQWTF